jgi:glutamate dehydrogenase/leucine dehydrogenase
MGSETTMDITAEATGAAPPVRGLDSQWRSLGDDLGPAQILLIREPAVDLEAVVVVDNTACGPAIGGVRMAADVTVAEVARLARAMTIKNAAAGLPHGGAKAAIIAGTRTAPAQKETLVRVFAQAIRSTVAYIPGPDMGTDERCMAWIREEIGRAVGLPRVIGGIPLDEIGATGFGLAVAAEVAQEFAGIALRGARIAIQGFGAVGRHAALGLIERGARLVAVADSQGAVVDSGGLPVADLIALKRQDRSVTALPDVERISLDDLVAVDCDIWIPAARPDVLTAVNASRVRARLVLQGANIPATPEAERVLHERGVLSVPDVIANAGGVICAAVEYRGGTQHEALTAIEERIRANTRAILERARQAGDPPRTAALELARARVAEAMTLRRWR